MSSPLPIERLHTLQAGETFDLPDGWIFYSYKCKEGATVTISNFIDPPEEITDDDSGSSFNNYSGGFRGMKFTANTGIVLLKWY